MKSSIIAHLHRRFEQSVRTADGVEFWFARDLQLLLGYSRWENFLHVIEKAKTACKTAGYEVPDHFPDVTKMVPIGSGTEREIDDIALTRYACYLVAQNGDPRKAEIAFAQTYFAIQTRKQELIEQRMSELERLSAREKLTASEKELSGVIFERLGDGQSFARIRSHGDRALFGGRSTQVMKEHLGVPDGRPLADFLPTITIKAKDFANEITTFNLRRDGFTTEVQVSDEHVRNNEGVRAVLVDRGIMPEILPPAEDIKKVERRVQAEERRLPAVPSVHKIKGSKG